MARNTARLLILCPDRPGIIAAVAGFVSHHGGNILEADQHSDPQHGEFFMRLEIDLGGFGLDRSSFENSWTPVAARFDMRWRVYWGNEIKRLAILVTRESHCLNDLLWRWRTGELPVEIPCVIGNHPDLQEHAASSGVPFRCIPAPSIRSNSESCKMSHEAEMRKTLHEHRIDLLVLARYMQVLSPSFVAEYPDRIINIHHSFLPAFAGPRPYHQAYERGVKLIGATSHYVTDVLDQGPIIAQATLPVNHRDTLDDLIRKGRDLERVVLATAVRQHVEDKILVSQNRTIVFD